MLKVWHKEGVVGKLELCICGGYLTVMVPICRWVGNVSHLQAVEISAVHARHMPFAKQMSDI